MALAETDRLDRLRTLLLEVGPDVRAAEAMWGSTTSPGIARLRTAEGQLARRDGDLDAARTLLQQAVGLARTFGEAPGLVNALTSLAEVELDCQESSAAYAALSEAREVVTNDPVLPQFVAQLEAAEKRSAVNSVRQAQRTGMLLDELDRPRTGRVESLGRRCDTARDRRRTVPVHQHRQGLHQGALPQARR